MRKTAYPIYKSAKVIEAVEEYEGYVKLLIREERLPQVSLPGQFVMIKGRQDLDPLLPRPFDVVQVNPAEKALRIIFKIVGRGTALLKKSKPGDSLMVTGPLGRGISDFSCGARRFARHVKKIDSQGTTEGFVFLEGLMACGLGHCHGCAVQKDGSEGYYLVCQDGPLFPVREVMIE